MPNDRNQRERDWEHWDDRSSRINEEHGDRSIERYGQGQSGYGAGRIEGDRSFSSRNQAAMTDYDQSRDRGGDERFVGGRGGQNWRPGDRGERGIHGNQAPSGYGHPGRWSDETGGGYLGQSGQQMGYYGQNHPSRDPRQFSGYGPQGYGQHGYGPQDYRASGSGQGGHRGKGPSGYIRSDERIREMVCDVLTDHDGIDASNINVSVRDGEVTLTGTVEDRHTKRLAEDTIEHVSGVKEVVNQLRTSGRNVSGNGGPAVERSGQPQSGSSSDKRHRA